MNDDKVLISLEEAMKRLPDGDIVHTFRQGGHCLIGADHERDRIIEAMRRAPEIEVTGPQAQAMRHGLAICDEHGWLFIQTKKLEAAPPNKATNAEGPRGTHGCSCVDRDSMQCAAIRYGMEHYGEPCECPCHQWSDEDGLEEPEWQNDIQAAFGGMVQTPQG